MARNALEPSSAAFASIMPAKAVTPAQHSADHGPQRRRVVMLGAAQSGTQARRLAAETDMLVHVELPHLDAAWLVRFQPDLVISPLIARSWDILDLAEKLVASGYSGPLMVQTGPLPRAELVIGEIKSLFPELSLIFVEMAD